MMIIWESVISLNNTVSDEEGKFYDIGTIWYFGLQIVLFFVDIIKECVKGD